MAKKNKKVVKTNTTMTKQKPMGKMILKYRIGSGCNATVYSAYFPSLNTSKIVKRINLDFSSLYCLLKWKRAGLKLPKKYVPDAPEHCVENLYSNIEEIEETLQLTGGKKGKGGVKTLLARKVGSDLCISRISCAIRKNAKEIDGATTVSMAEEFINEVEVGKVVRDVVNQVLPSPTFCRVFETWKTTVYGNIAMEDAGVSLEDVIYKMKLNQFKSIILQILISLCWAQKVSYFKHHDLHSGNAFMKRRNVKKTWELPSGSSITLPDTNYQAIIADFGLSSITDPRTKTRHCRLDYGILDTEERGWGIWEDGLEGNEGYDIAVLLHSLIDDCDRYDGYIDPDIEEWVQNLMKLLRSQCPQMRISKKQGRPLCNIPLNVEEYILNINF
jgi:serine/threonine protein kinase